MALTSPPPFPPPGPVTPGQSASPTPLDNRTEVLATQRTGAAFLYQWALTAAERTAMEADGFEAVHLSVYSSWLMKKSLDKTASRCILAVTVDD